MTIYGNKTIFVNALRLGSIKLITSYYFYTNIYEKVTDYYFFIVDKYTTQKYANYFRKIK